MKILVCDDHSLIVEDIIDELKSFMPGAFCVGTSNALQVMELFEENRFDAALLDIDMPGINGLDLAKQILEIYPDTNIIYITAHEKYALESYNTYASAFLVKPVTRERLEDAFANLRHPVSDLTEEIIRERYSGTAAIGARIELYRERRQLTRKEFASRMNVSVQTVYRWENGERLPDIVTLLEISRELGANINNLVGTE